MVYRKIEFASGKRVQLNRTAIRYQDMHVKRPPIHYTLTNLVGQANTR